MIRYWLDSDRRVKKFEVKRDPGKILALPSPSLLLDDLGLWELLLQGDWESLSEKVTDGCDNVWGI